MIILMRSSVTSSFTGDAWFNYIHAVNRLGSGNALWHEYNIHCHEKNKAFVTRI